MGDGAEERERDIRGETFLNRSDEGEWVDRVPFYFCPLHRLDFEYFESGGRGEEEGEKCGEDTRGTNRRNSSPDGSRIFLRLKVEVTVRPNDLRDRIGSNEAAESFLPYHHRLINLYSELING